MQHFFEVAHLKYLYKRIFYGYTYTPELFENPYL